MRELFDVRPEFISLVEEGANRKKFKIFKSADFKEEELPQNKKGRYQELAEKFYKESFIEKVKEHMKDWFDRLRKAQDEIDNDEKGGGTMNKEKEKELEEQKKAKAEEDRIKAEEDRIKAEKDAKEKEEKAKADKEMKVRVAEAVASILQDKEKLEELKGLIAKVEKGEEIKPEEITKLKEALDLKEEEKPEEMAEKIKALEAKVKELEKGKKKSVTGQDDEPEGKKWPSLSG